MDKPSSSTEEPSSPVPVLPEELHTNHPDVAQMIDEATAAIQALNRRSSMDRPTQEGLRNGYRR